jgi:Ca-activated chloride channel family protein
MIANQSGGKYFRATNETELKDIYDEIDQLEKTKIEQNVFKRYNDEFEWLVWIGLGILLLELLLGLTFLKTMPG